MIPKSEYQRRRLQLANSLPAGAIAIIPGAKEMLRNGDTHFPFRQDSDFFYFTGFEEPDALLVIKQEGQSFLFNRPRHPSEEQWTGKRLGQVDAIDILGIDKAFPIDSITDQLPELLKGSSELYYNIGQTWDNLIFKTIQNLKNEVRRGISAPQAIVDIDNIISEMRLIKDHHEILCLRKAARISIAAHKRAMQACKQLSNEGQLEAEFLYELNRQGLKTVAYPPIVGAGFNSCILHYQDNNKDFSKGDLVLIDAGGEAHNYAADITRTYPVNGIFSYKQRAIYDLVLKAQKAGIACIKPGISWAIIQETMVHILTEGLVELGILAGKTKDLIESGAYKPYYMHNSGHWLGLDVHDCARYKIDHEWRTLKPGMVLTVEPGLYLKEDLPGLDKKWWNIGVRIEDDILVTEEGHENLTQDLPSEINDIEALMRG